MKQLRTIWYVAVKDLRLELRNPEILLASLTLAVLMLVIFRITLPDVSVEVAPAIIWAALVFAATTGFNRSFAVEQDGGAIDGLRGIPVGGELLILGKTIANFSVLNIVTALILAASVVLFGFAYLHPIIIVAHLLANLGLCLIGTTFAAITMRLRARDILLSLLLIPLVFPLLFAAISIARVVLNDGNASELASWFIIIIIFNVVALALTTFLARTVLGESS